MSEGASDASQPSAEPPPGSDPHGEPAREREDDAARCDLCGAEMMELHCKLTCLRCGYQRDCSDP